MEFSDLTIADFEASTTFVKREWERELKEGLASGRLTQDDVDAERAESEDVRREIVMGTAEKMGVLDDPDQLAVVDSRVDEEITRLGKIFDDRLTERAKLIFAHIGHRSHPGCLWDELSLTHQDEFRRAARELGDEIRDAFEIDDEDEYSL